MSFLTSRKCLAPYGIGKSVPRREDARLLTGAGQYADDFNLPGQAYAYLARSPHPHATIVKTDVAQAVGGPGIIAVLTGSDAAADGLKPIPHSRVPTNPHEVPLRNRDGSGVLHRTTSGSRLRRRGSVQPTTPNSSRFRRIPGRRSGSDPQRRDRPPELEKTSGRPAQTRTRQSCDRLKSAPARVSSGIIPGKRAGFVCR
jgi:hypothetical protein